MRLLIIMLFSAFFNFSALAATTEWELDKEEEDIQLKIYTREIEGSSLKEFKGEMLVETKLSTLVALLLDDKAAPQWMHQCEKFEVLEHANEQEAIVYFVNGAPWPVSDRDAVVASEVTQDPETLVVTFKLAALNDYLPENDDYVRIPRMKGFWSFTPMAEGKVLVRYQIHAEPGGSLPAWLANTVVVDTPYNTMSNMLKMLKLEKYQQAEVSFIKNRD